MSRRHRRSLVCLGAILVAMGVVAAAITTSTVASLDVAAVQAVHGGVVAPSVTSWVLGLTALGGTDVVLQLTAISSAALLLLGRWRGALVLLLSVLLTQVVVAGAKALFSRPRPADDVAVGDPSGFSFPSGHSATALALYLTLALIVAARLRGPKRVGVAVVGAGVALAIGASRVYLGVHYPTDVVAGWLTGAAVAVGCWLLVDRIGAMRAGPRTASA